MEFLMTISSLIIVARSAIFRDGLKRLISSETMAIAAELPSLVEAVSLLRVSSQGINLLICYYDSDGTEELAVLEELSREFPAVKSVIVAREVNAAELAKAYKAGARAFLPSDISAAALCLSLQLVALGEDLFAAPASISRVQIAAQPTTFSSTRVLRSPLSEREHQILDQLGKGAPNKVIARDLGMAEATVKVHIKAVLRKLDVSNRTQAAVWAMNHHTLDHNSR
jgi:two-component system, NarL family, nitrate/nitrite response regulator NarL